MISTVIYILCLSEYIIDRTLVVILSATASIVALAYRATIVVLYIKVMANKISKKGEMAESGIFQGFLAITSAFFNFANRIFACSSVIPGASFGV